MVCSLWNFEKGTIIVNLYKNSTGGLLELGRDRFPLERDIQGLVEHNLQTIFSLKFVASELTVDKFRIDTLAYDEENNSFVIIEYKKGHSYSVVDQGYSYLSVMLNNKAEFILEYNERMDQSLRRDDVDWSASRVIFVSQSFNSYQRNSVNFKNIPFELWEVRRFEGGIISFNQHQSESKEDISLVSDLSAGSVMATVASEIKIFEESDHLAAASQVCLALWEAVKSELNSWEDVTQTATKSYIGFKKNNTLFATVRIFKNHLNLDISRGNISADGKNSRNFFTADDPKAMLEERNWTHKSGVRGNAYLLKISKNEQLEYVKFLVKQKYDSI